jgi:hypothetical protein
VQASIIRQLELPNLPSASGVEIVGDMVYIIGDDSPYLYCFDSHNLGAGQRLSLFETAHFSSGRIPKDVKADLECLTALTTATGETGLLACGSGATSARENGFWVPLAGAGGPAATVYPVALGALYSRLRGLLPAGVTLNLEAVAATDSELLLFQRTVGSAATNFVFRLPLAAAVKHLLHQATLPPVRAQHYQLPTVQGKPAGFSGATVFDNRLFITASVEDTTDAVLDGEVLGSFVGVLNLDGPANQPVAFARLALPGGKPYRGKVESVAVRRALGAGRYELLLVTDDDQGGSTAVIVEVWGLA